MTPKPSEADTRLESMICDLQDKVRSRIRRDGASADFLELAVLPVLEETRLVAVELAKEKACAEAADKRVAELEAALRVASAARPSITAAFMRGLEEGKPEAAALAGAEAGEREVAEGWVDDSDYYHTVLRTGPGYEGDHVCTVQSLAAKHNGKRVRLTVEVIDPKEAP